MSFFRYEAVDRAGKVVMGTMDAASEADVSARLAQLGYRPQSVLPTSPAGRTGAHGTKPSPQAAAAAGPSVPTASSAGAKPAEQALFFRQFAALLRSGINIYQALETLGPRSRPPVVADAARDMADAARTGGRISDVMERYPRLYAPHVVAAVRGGELGGFLEIVLDEIALDFEQEVALHKGMWLPKALIVQELFAIALAQPLFPTLWPQGQFAVYLKLAFLRNVPIAIGLVVVYRLLYAWASLPRNREWRDRWMLRAPVYGDLVRQRSLAAFIRMLRRLFHAGVGPIQAWEGAMNVAPNTVIRGRLVDAYALMRSNVPLHDAFTATGLFANETEQLIATGVVSGQLVDMLDRVAQYYQDNVDRAFNNSRFWGFRMSFALLIALVGGLLIIMVYTYFHGTFDTVNAWFPELQGALWP